MELIGSELERTYAVFQYGNPSERSSGYHDLTNSETYSDDFHIFAKGWEPDQTRRYLDNNLFHSASGWITIGRKDAQFPAPYDQDFT